MSQSDKHCRFFWCETHKKAEREGTDTGECLLVGPFSSEGAARSWNGAVAKSSPPSSIAPRGIRVSEAIVKMNDCVLNTDASGRPDGALVDAWTALVGALSTPSATRDKSFTDQLIEADGRRYAWLREQQGALGEDFGALVAEAALALGVPADIVDSGNIERIIDNAILRRVEK